MTAASYMEHSRTWLRQGLNWQWVEHSGRTAVATRISLLIAREFRLQESYWAAVTTLIVMQSTAGAALVISGRATVCWNLNYA
jgi:hypothetical protein